MDPLACAHSLADRCCADVLLAPMVDGQPDFDADREAFEWAPEPSAEEPSAGLSAADAARLCLRIDCFDSYSARVNPGATVVRTLDGRYFIRRGDSHELAAAREIIERALAGGEMVDGGYVRPRQRRAHANDNRSPKTGPQRVLKTVDASSLLAMEFEPVRYVVPGYIAEGLTLLAGRPKLGKSWFSLGVSLAVATGGNALGAIPCDQGDVLYLALEDNERRLQGRLLSLLPKLVSRPDVSRLRTATAAPKINAGLIEALDDWRNSVANPRLVTIDTLAMVRSPKGRNQDPYSADYEAISPLQRWASEHRVAVVVVTHVRKAEAVDPLEAVSGTNGLTGAADAILVLTRDTSGPKLYGRGRDVDEIDKALRFDGGRWSVVGNSEDVKRSDERKQIIRALADARGALRPEEIAQAVGKKTNTVNVRLSQMVKSGEVEKVGYGAYRLPPSDSSESSLLAE
ncbi:AAA family ATPase [Phreatobacter sp. AB_2022a]|uniref:AAA family ATPase n=1 Tax=Phreatobacter sp. AB_2022a TaxID=3003134 RepID=UPI00228734FB|nr:AAA family ATPase [Phreatobacter sp. AB_2022a]MCZ0734583.1 AAA family ATPase [Phreatobacter sp. AB_2022a]